MPRVAVNLISDIWARTGDKMTPDGAGYGCVQLALTRPIRNLVDRLPPRELFQYMIL